MSTPAQADDDEGEEEVEFVSEGPLKPMLECIDLLSDSEDEGCSSLAGTLEDEITRHKAHVTSTLDRLAHQVALEKKERADKCRAFKEKQILQKAHGQQELAFSSENGVNLEAKRCVDMWLKMPGLTPGVISSGSGRRRVPASFSRSSVTRNTCPVINCGRVYDNASLLDGHLKRFDHSPCDPAINLKGCPSELFACVACAQFFQTKEAWRKHLEDKVSSASADNHNITQAYQRIVCFACPACYLLFNLRDECLQHMSAKNHFTEALAMTEPRGRARPVPVPQYAKNCLIASCKEVAFNVRCSLCHKVLISHQAAQAHFNVHCRQGCAVAKADKTIVQVMKQLQVQGQCTLCCKIFLSQAEIEKHRESTQHNVEVNQTMEKAILQHRRFGEIQPHHRAKEAQRKRQSTSLEESFQKRIRKENDFSSKHQRHSPTLNDSTSKNVATAWYCECGLPFSEEAAASKHLLAVNQIFHQCGVCGKHMGESSITRLHMSRFHGGAHLSNFLLYCRKCKLEMPRYEDILLHVSEAHRGHTYFTEQEVPEEVATVIDAKPSTSSEAQLHSSSRSTVQQNTAGPSPSKGEQTWMCRMCEDIFDSEAAVQKHCSDVSSHSFQKFICGHCPQKFFKESTVRRHCMNEHEGQIKSSHFCGLCDSMQFESESEFLEHYKSLHSKDYYCMEDVEVVQATHAESTSSLTCPCMGSEKNEKEMKATYTQCMRNLATEGKCEYVCTPCSVSLSSYAQMKTHVHTKHAALNLEKTFNVECKACQESFVGVPSFHKHYHCCHCILEPCINSRNCKKVVKEELTTVKILDAVEVKPDTNDGSDDEMKHALSVIDDESRESAELEEALKRSLLEF
ncbi:E3 SUMO-protein ligase ZNF451 [Echeneis naucrates]|uniref:C2H2-type domain-containing protein n=1 Tax=Echeneis naucrates TaxID=173247 RepID=A0A665X808_ECHNA|nr:E3 SUMO-protein ligase ZNF451 [Echeneis naucrates]XP_029377032.1 E3 SUMO-protein ligase ZNF451 [Echeneis naucrates]XP_029377033.1 E3 SUMO-protein ligase ZNF451 [Echeneis naucrates]XP_029377034.1 E3 SUMO-protein ligase ZNF451 [Echeneis naucrates]